MFSRAGVERAGDDLSCFFFVLLCRVCYRGVGKSGQTRPARASFSFGVGSNVKTSGKQLFESFESCESFESFSAGGGFPTTDHSLNMDLRSSRGRAAGR